MIISGDWHIAEKRPENRVDDYLETCFRKLTFIFETARQNNIYTILQPGDFTDSPFMSWALFVRLINFLEQYSEINVISCFGQHDLRFRSKTNCALVALSAACKNINVLDINNPVDKFIPVSVYGSSYNEQIPEITTQGFNILITHRMMIQDKLWEGQAEYTQAGSFLRSNKFQLIVSGDNHQSFVVDTKLLKKQLFNCGSLLRSKTDQLEHRPFIVIYDTDSQEYEQVFIPIEPAEKIFNLEKVVKEKEKNENLASFVTGLSESKEIGLKFEDNLNGYLNENNVGTEVREIIEWAKTGENN